MRNHASSKARLGRQMRCATTVTRLATTVILLLLAAPLAADAQPTGKVYRIGFILTATPDETGHLSNAVFCDVFVMTNARIKRLTTYLAEVK